MQRYPQFRPWFLQWGMSLPQETSLFRRDAFESVGGLDRSLHMAMDFDLWCKFAKQFEIHHIPVFLARFRAHQNNKSTIFTQEETATGFDKGFPAELAMIYEKHFGSKLPGWKRKHFSKLKSLLYLKDRQTKNYKQEVKRSKEIREL